MFSRWYILMPRLFLIFVVSVPHSYPFLMLLVQYVDERNQKGSRYKEGTCQKLQRSAFTVICGGWLYVNDGGEGGGARVDVGWDGSPSQYCKPSAWTNIISGLSGWKSSSSAVSYSLNYLQRGLKARALAASLLLMLSMVPQENVLAARRLVQRCRQSRYCKTFMSCTFFGKKNPPPMPCTLVKLEPLTRVSFGASNVFCHI